MKVLRIGLKILLPVLVLAVCGILAVNIVKSREAPQRRDRPQAVLQVEVHRAAPSRYEVMVSSQGTVRPRTESTLIPEVSGRVIEVSPKLRAGEFFEAGDVLLELDAREYKAAATIARAELTRARAQLAEEMARAEQAQREWRRLGEKGKPDDLVLRKPQVASARASVSSAQARLVQRELDLERTRIVAPYAGRVLEKQVDVGQYVTVGTQLARIYAIDYVEVRLPLSDQQLQFVDVPELIRQVPRESRPQGPAVTLSTQIGRTRHEWQGRVVRAEGAIDTRTRQLYVVAQVDDPYGAAAAQGYPLKIGQFVQADIQGTGLEGVFVIPRDSLRAGNQVLVVDAESRLRYVDVEVIWTDDTQAVIGKGLKAGDRVVTTSLSEGLSGTLVRVKGAGESGQQKKRAGARAQGEGKERS